MSIASLEDAISEADVLYMTRIQKERFSSEVSMVYTCSVVISYCYLSVIYLFINILHSLIRMVIILTF